METRTHGAMENSPRYFQLRRTPFPNAITHALTGTREREDVVDRVWRVDGCDDRDDCDSKSCAMRYLHPLRRGGGTGRRTGLKKPCAFFLYERIVECSR